ncbi:DUF6790 family protein [Paracoccus sp. AK26]|uniref:DUF6790 family protein n=1 Tax=Paracoccus sp. AK26 TaxID=2589076 RepID=UPI0014288917|nr:DUF6790 family protein [Paracoccus sp. AK26]QIR86987.1 hypothetical protein FIU66_17050 [Paracoccus sp. AK26]
MSIGQSNARTGHGHDIFVLSTTVVLPVAFVLFFRAAGSGDHVVALAGTWFVFWGIGIRLLVAGISQVVRPSLTAAGILGIADPAAEKLVRELGIANIAMGLLATASLVVPAWTAPAAFLGAVFLGLAGLRHGSERSRTRPQNLAMVTDLLVAAVALGYLLLDSR